MDNNDFKKIFNIYIVKFYINIFDQPYNQDKLLFLLAISLYITGETIKM